MEAVTETHRTTCLLSEPLTASDNTKLSLERGSYLKKKRGYIPYPIYGPREVGQRGKRRGDSRKSTHER